MSPLHLAMIAFVATSLTSAALLMMFRDLFFPRRTVVEERLLGGDRVEADLAPAPKARGRGFGVFSVDTGVWLSFRSVVLWSVTFGIVAGAALFVWRDDWMAAAAAALIAMLTATVMLSYLRSRRRWAVLEQLPEVTEYLSRAAHGGASLDQGIAMVAESGFRPLSAEFRRCARQLDLGLSFDWTMHMLTRRIPLVETRVLAAALRVQRQTGGNLAVTLERLAAVFRDRLNFYRQFRALTATSRTSAILIVVLAVVIDAYALIYRPEYAKEILTSSMGQTMVGLALALQVIGVLWAYTVLNTDY